MFMMRTPEETKENVGREMPPSDWVTVDQNMIDRFADATGDHQWIHVDVARAEKEMPGGKTIAHGYLVLSLMPKLAQEIWKIETYSRALNYGSDKVRFLNPVPAGSRVRLHKTIKAADDVKGGGVRVISSCEMELEGAAKPALIAETIAIYYP